MKTLKNYLKLWLTSFVNQKLCWHAGLKCGNRFYLRCPQAGWKLARWIWKLNGSKRNDCEKDRKRHGGGFGETFTYWDENKKKTRYLCRSRVINPRAASHAPRYDSQPIRGGLFSFCWLLWFPSLFFALILFHLRLVWHPRSSRSIAGVLRTLERHIQARIISWTLEKVSTEKEAATSGLKARTERGEALENSWAGWGRECTITREDGSVLEVMQARSSWETCIPVVG